MSGPTKTRRDRVVDIRPEAVKLLRVQRTRCIELRLAAGPAWEDRDLVFPTESGRPLDANTMQRGLDNACERAGIPRRTIKDTRHTFATLALRAGVHPKIVQEAMGHTSIAITLDTYSHLVPTMQAEAMVHLDRLFS